MNLSRQILVTGADGFIGQNLVIRLKELCGIKVVTFTRKNSASELPDLVLKSDFIFHLAGVNRPTNPEEFSNINAGLTELLCHAIRATGRNIPLVFASSLHASLDTPYGHSKLAAESIIQEFSSNTSNAAYIYRLPGVFGKWCKPNYNSVVATFCHNISRNLPIQIDSPDKVINLVYVDDVIDEFLSIINKDLYGLHFVAIKTVYSISIANLAQQIAAFKESRETLVTERVGAGLVRALYATYISHLPPQKFFYDLPVHGDDRGIFVEMLKTPDCGQFSFFTVHPGITRGSHYHHTKSEKFFLVQGLALMKFRNLITDEIFEVRLSPDRPRVVETIPGWAHDITNIGHQQAIILLWANEIFDLKHPDCIPCKV